MRLALLPLACLAALALAAPASAAEFAVSAEDNVFRPATVRIQPGDSVKWTWAGAVEHTVTANANQTERFASPTQTTGTFSHTFADRGRFTYFCDIHPVEMRGVVEVGAAPFPDTLLPRVTKLKARVRGRSVRVSFRLSERARVRLKLSGASSEAVSGRLGKGARKLRIGGLRPGRYRASLTATDAAGNKTRKAARTSFRVSR